MKSIFQHGDYDCERLSRSVRRRLLSARLQQSTFLAWANMRDDTKSLRLEIEGQVIKRRERDNNSKSARETERLEQKRKE